ncbi:hypothetical protein [Longimicrobium sp.]|uniref:hypothetical protein n=1 Tax=Longimicrobium sp. TaxID=2029185 RepID=UPI002E36EA18|nr:hypothetical protein [Longimicrobium sp.]HEX6040177.1 hypothetical protein [Longimicrobium sp.]
MDKFTLNLEDLAVTSFDTTSAYVSPDIIAPTTDPTAATRCFICPPRTLDCY